MAGVYHIARRTPEPPPLAFSDFLHQVEAGSIAEVHFGEHAMSVVMQDGTAATTVAPPEFLAANSSFVTDLVRRNIKVDVAAPADPTSLSWSAMATAAAFLALLGFTVYRTTAGRIPSLSARARVAERGDLVITFQDVAGVDEAKDEVKEIVDFLKEPGTPVSARRASAGCSATPAVIPPASCSSTSSTRSAAAAAATP